MYQLACWQIFHKVARSSKNCDRGARVHRLVAYFAQSDLGTRRTIFVKVQLKMNSLFLIGSLQMVANTHRKCNRGEGCCSTWQSKYRQLPTPTYEVIRLSKKRSNCEKTIIENRDVLTPARAMLKQSRIKRVLSNRRP